MKLKCLVSLGISLISPSFLFPTHAALGALSLLVGNVAAAAAAQEDDAESSVGLQGQHQQEQLSHDHLSGKPPDEPSESESTFVAF